MQNPLACGRACHATRPGAWRGCGNEPVTGGPLPQPRAGARHPARLPSGFWI